MKLLYWNIFHHFVLLEFPQLLPFFIVSIILSWFSFTKRCMQKPGTYKVFFESLATYKMRVIYEFLVNTIVIGDLILILPCILLHPCIIWIFSFRQKKISPFSSDEKLISIATHYPLSISIIRDCRITGQLLLTH